MSSHFTQKICNTFFWCDFSKYRFSLSLSFIYLFFLSFLGPLPWHMEVPRLAVKSELWLLATATAIATRAPSHVCDLHHSSGNTGYLTHWARPGIEPMSSWILVGFVSTAPRRELQVWIFLIFMRLLFQHLPVCLVTYHLFYLCYFAYEFLSLSWIR